MCWKDRLLGTLASLLALFLYWRTLAPGLINIRDTPSFQYVGRILGIPHQPGYPFYLLVSHLFSLLPTGNLAYRMNLLSAVLGAVSVALLYEVLRALRCSRAVAFSFALCAALGPITWSQSIIAEVDPLESVLVLATLLSYLRWRTTRSRRGYFLAVFCFGLAVAHHPDEWTLALGLLAFEWSTDRTMWRRADAWLLASGAVLLAFAPYALILVRTAQNAPYVLEPAHNLTDLWRIYSEAGYHVNLFVFPLATVLSQRIPLIFGLLWSEVGSVGIVLAAVGAVTLARRDRAVALLLGIQLLGQFAFTVNYDVPDIAVFVIPLALVLWIGAAVGAERVWQGLVGLAAQVRPKSDTTGIADTAGRRTVTAAAGVALLALPVWSVSSHYDAVDLSWNSSTMRYMDSAVRQMPDRAVVIGGNWAADHLLLYHTLGEGLRRGQSVEGPMPGTSAQVDRWLAVGTAVYAFESRAEELRLAGFSVAPEPVHVPVAVALRAVRPGFTIAVAAPLAASAGLDDGSASGLAAMNGTIRMTGRQFALAAIGVRGARQRAFERTGPREASLLAAAGEAVPGAGARLRAPVEVFAGDIDAHITVDGRDIVRTSAGIAVAVWDHDGNLVDTGVSVRSRGGISLQPPLLFRVAAPRQCATLAAGSQALGLLAASGAVAVSLPNDSHLSLDTTSAALLDASRASRYALTWADGGAAWTLAAGTQQPDSWALVSLGSTAASTTARPESAATVCSLDPRWLLTDLDGQTFVVGMANDAQRFLLGPGWNPPRPSAGGAVRTTRERAATLTVPLEPEDAWSIRVVARPGDEPGSPSTIGLRLNGVSCGEQSTSADWHTYAWTARSLATTATQVQIEPAGLVVGAIFFTRETETPGAASKDKVPECQVR